MVEYARCNRAGNRPSEADESVPVYAAVRAGQLQTGRTRTVPPQRAQLVDLRRGLIFTSTAIKTATETASITVSIFQIMFYSSFKTHYISLRLNTPYTAISDTTAHTAATANAPPTVFADALRSSSEI